MGVVLIQNFNMKKGIAIFGDRSETKVMKYLQKIHDMNNYEPMDASTLTYQDRKYALTSLLFITQKINRDIKERKVDVGRNQKTYDGYNNINGQSTTVNTDSDFITGLIDAHDHRAVEMLDIDNAFIHTENDKYVLIMIRGKLAELLVKVDPKLYRKYVIKSKQRVTMLYVKLIKDLYGMLHSTILSYKNIRRNEEEIGFETNPYDPCV